MASKTQPDISVLISVYGRDNSKYFRLALESIYNQTSAPKQIVLVEDGPISKDLEQIVEEYKQKDKIRLDIVKLKNNKGLGVALNEGLKKCKYEYVARMDSDDICDKDRIKKQWNFIKKNKDIDIFSGTIKEFSKKTENITGERRVPKQHKDIIGFSKKRNPFNHPAVVFRKKAVLDAGGYNESYHLFEDYYLWIRMLMNGCKTSNLDDTLVYMRTSSDSIKRRGGIKYATELLRFQTWLLRVKWISPLDYAIYSIPHFVVCILPNNLRAMIYKTIR